MSRTLASIHATLSTVRAQAKIGRRYDALQKVTALLERTDLPADLEFEAHRLAGEELERLLARWESASAELGTLEP